MQSQYNLRNPAVKRLMKEAQELKDPTELYHAQPLEDNLFEWHFTFRGPDESSFEGGIYHGRIILPPEYPMKPPSIIILTPNGRFEIFKKICLSISGHHPESWQPSWSIRTALLAIIGFMPTHGNGAIGSLDYTTAERKVLAKKSQDWNCQQCGRVSEILKPVTEASKSASKEALELASQISFQAEKNGKKQEKDEKESGTDKTNQVENSGDASSRNTQTQAGNAQPPGPVFGNGQFAPPPNMFPFMPPYPPGAAPPGSMPQFAPPPWGQMNMQDFSDRSRGQMPPFWPPPPMMMNPAMHQQFMSQFQQAYQAAQTQQNTTTSMSPAVSSQNTNSISKPEGTTAATEGSEAVTSHSGPQSSPSSDDDNSESTTNVKKPTITESGDQTATSSSETSDSQTPDDETTTEESRTPSPNEGLRQRVTPHMVHQQHTPAELERNMDAPSDHPFVYVVMAILSVVIAFLITRRIFMFNIWKMNFDYDL